MTATYLASATCQESQLSGNPALPCVSILHHLCSVTHPSLHKIDLSCSQSCISVFIRNVCGRMNALKSVHVDMDDLIHEDTDHCPLPVCLSQD